VDKIKNIATIIRPATESDYEIIAGIGKVAVAVAHGASCSAEDLNHYLSAHYNHDAIKGELTDPRNNYHIIYSGAQAAGFSKIILDMQHPNIPQPNVTKLDRIYLLEEFYGLKLGYELLQFNIELSRKNGQSGMWLFTWTGNERAVSFYKKAGFTIIGEHQFKVSETHYNPNYHMYLRY
jgi:ribosomal protein S18 acetylase RimI-like enzyme